jgi:hypothetical protein
MKISGLPLGSRRGAAVVTLVLGVLLWLSLISLPMAPATDLDASWQEMLVYGHARGWQFGRDVIFTWGPWGMLCSVFHLGRMGAVTKLVWEVGGKALLAGGLIALTGALPLWRRAVFVLACLLFHWFFLDVIYFVFVTLVVIRLMQRAPASGPWVGWVAALAFLAEFKFTYTVLTAGGVMAVAWVWWRRGREVGRDGGGRGGGGGGRGGAAGGGAAAGLLAAYGAALLVFWVAAGQSPDNLWPYLRRSLEIATGYGDAMMLDEPAAIFWVGLAVGAAGLLFCWRVGRGHSDRALAWGAAGFLAAAGFLMWKEGFVRADGHVYGFFCYGLLAVLVVPALLYPARRFNWVEGAALGCGWGVWLVAPVLVVAGPRISWERLCGNARMLPELTRLPGEWEEALATARSAAALPEIRRVVGGRSVDVYNFRQGVALLNEFNLTPRPVFQSYSAYTPGLDGWNLRFYGSGRAPDFLLWAHDSIDSRYPSIDDASLVVALAHHYRPVLREGEYWLLEKQSSVSAAPLRRHLLLDRTVRLGEEVAAPFHHGDAVWFQARLELTKLGRLRALAYKAPLIQLTVTDDQDGRTTWRVLPRIAVAGFLLDPLLATGDDLVAFLEGERRVGVRALCLDCPADQAEFWGSLQISLFALPDLPLRTVARAPAAPAAAGAPVSPPTAAQAL